MLVSHFCVYTFVCIILFRIAFLRILIFSYCILIRITYTYAFVRIALFRTYTEFCVRACDGLRTKKSNTKKCVYEEMRCEKMRYEKLRYEHLRTKKCDAEKSIRTFVLGPSRSFEAGRRKFMETKPPPPLGNT